MPLPVVLLGNKIDLDDAEVDKGQLDKFCEEKNFVGWFDTSAKQNINIDKAAKFLVEKILEHKDIFQKKKAAQDTFQPGVGNKGAKASGCC
jgi:Ras-related protein Rab-32